MRLFSSASVVVVSVAGMVEKRFRIPCLMASRSRVGDAGIGACRLANETISSSGNFLWVAEICLDRLLKQRSALPNQNFPLICRRFARITEFVGRSGLHCGENFE